MPFIPFPLLALGLLYAALLILNLLSGAPGGIYFVFVPALLWGIVLILKGRS